MLSLLTVVLAAVPDTIEKKSGLPQLNVPDMAPQLIWLAAAFAVLYFILSRSTLPRIGAVIEERKSRIARDISEAERLNSETQNAIAEYEQRLAEARSSASAMSRENREKVEAELSAREKAFEAEDRARMADAEQRISAMKASAMAQVEIVSTEAAQEVVRKLIGAEVGADEVRQAMQRAGE